MTPPAPPWCDKEILHYLGGGDESLSRLIADCKGECEGLISPTVCSAEFTIAVDGDGIDFGAFRWQSRDLAKCLAGCSRAIVFVATVGFGIDRLIKKYGVVSPSRALVFSAIGNERVESVCDHFCDALAKQYGGMRPRFSPGYGDLPLESQRDIFTHLNISKHMDVTLNDSLLMSPAKTVSAIVGISE